MNLAELNERWPYENTIAWLRQSPDDRQILVLEWPSPARPIEWILNDARSSQTRSLIRLTIGVEYAPPDRVEPSETNGFARSTRLPRDAGRVAEDFLFGVIRTVRVSGIGALTRDDLSGLPRPSDYLFASTLQWLSHMAATPRGERVFYREGVPEFVGAPAAIVRVHGLVLGAFVAAYMTGADGSRLRPDLRESLMNVFVGQAVKVSEQWIDRLLRVGADLINELGGGTGASEGPFA